MQRRSPHVVVGFTPMGATPCLVELEDAESGRVRSVERDDPELVIDGAESLPTDDESPEPDDEHVRQAREDGGRQGFSKDSEAAPKATRSTLGHRHFEREGDDRW
jgi:hypothetical protein